MVGCFKGIVVGSAIIKSLIFVLVVASLCSCGSVAEERKVRDRGGADEKELRGFFGQIRQYIFNGNIYFKRQFYKYKPRFEKHHLSASQKMPFQMILTVGPTL